MPELSFADALRRPGRDRAAVVLDGGLATELERRGHDLSDALWSARLLRDAAAEIVAVHAAYFSAGADVATTASYQATFPGFAAAGEDAAGSRRLLRRSVQLAREAQAAVGDRPTWIAASVGPYGAMLADGSEYRGDYGLPVARLRAFHRPRLEVLAAAGADLLACETVPCLAEVEALLAELVDLGMPAWLSLTVDDGRTRRGEPAEQAYAMAADLDSVIAVGLNCCDPGDLENAVATAARASGKPVVVYPNSGETWDGVRRQWSGRPRFTATAVRRWLAAGARAVGGCCRVGPELIASVATATRDGRRDSDP